MTVQRVSSKWAKTKILLLNKSLASYVPDTAIYSYNELQHMLDAHILVYIKPDQGTYGNGVMCVEKASGLLEEHTSANAVHYLLRYETKTEVYKELDALHRAVVHLCGGKEYIIQKGITLLKKNGSPFDLRVLTQQTPSGSWESTGMIGRVAAHQKIITNHHSGGTTAHFRSLMKDHMNPEEAEQLRRKLKDLGVQVAGQLQKKYRNLKEIGLDIAIDERFHIWILEVNTKPALFPFKKFFKNPAIYRKVKKYALAYGRRKL
ncbi:YheC/YheD family protein [Paenibacillus sp. JSM ZJ436]|uniref:YheC/YheD family protein n=1 Tax=Paenibacillus sp. JSM ZJ436 TaxID=3376190 RepID=UPI0037B08427